VKPALVLSFASALLAAALAGCGQPGPLYLPPQLKPAGAANAPTPVLPSTTESASDTPTTGRASSGMLPGPVIPPPATPAPTQH
jgi:predicted small lipoprotein YifL